MKRSTFFKVFGGYVLLLILLSILFLVFSFGTVKKYHLKTLTGDLENLGRTLDNEIFPFLDQARLQDLDAFLKQQGRIIRTRLTVINPEGVVLADSEENPAKMQNHRFRPEIYEALQGRTGNALRYSSTVRQDMLYVALPLKRDQRIEGALRLSLFVRDIDVLLNALRTDIGRAVVILMLLALVAAFIFSRNLTRPIREMIRVSRQVAAGDFDARVRLRNRDEWRDLAQTFNGMTEEIKTLFADLRARKEELANIIASMQEGLLVLDKSGKVILSNESVKKLIGQEMLDGKFFWEVVRITPCVELIRRVKEEKSNVIEEVSLGEKSILCRASYLPAQDGAVVTFHDITEMQNLARIKKDFVLNVSHELRTPLTAIKGYAETLEAEVDEKDKSYVGTILRHTDRLIQIVEDLLTLATLEEKGVSFEVKEVNLRELAGNVLKIFEFRAKEKNLAMRLEADEGLPSIQGDPFRLEQMLVNLIDNAVKYTEKGSVQISLRKGEGGALIEVADTGIGIPEEDQGRIFERFYVVDKSRSRKLGGTGLGLSIVKYIVLLHGGKIDLKSAPGAGSQFSVFLPAARR